MRVKLEDRMDAGRIQMFWCFVFVAVKQKTDCLHNCSVVEKKMVY